MGRNSVSVGAVSTRLLANGRIWNIGNPLIRPSLQRRGLELPLGRDVLKRFSRRDHQTPSKAASTACAGRSTRQGSTSTA